MVLNEGNHMTDQLHHLTLNSDEIRETAACLINTLERVAERAPEPLTQAVLQPCIVSAFRKVVEAMNGIDPQCEDVEHWALGLFGFPWDQASSYSPTDILAPPDAHALPEEAALTQR
jgi:hypothetical protein